MFLLLAHPAPPHTHTLPPSSIQKKKYSIGTRFEVGHIWTGIFLNIENYIYLQHKFSLSLRRSVHLRDFKGNSREFIISHICRKAGGFYKYTPPTTAKASPERPHSLQN